jgi:hypothetical protein
LWLSPPKRRGRLPHETAALTLFDPGSRNEARGGGANIEAFGLADDAQASIAVSKGSFAV